MTYSKVQLSINRGSCVHQDYLVVQLGLRQNLCTYQNIICNNVTYSRSAHGVGHIPFCGIFFILGIILFWKRGFNKNKIAKSKRKKYFCTPPCMIISYTQLNVQIVQQKILSLTNVNQNNYGTYFVNNHNMTDV